MQDQQPDQREAQEQTDHPQGSPGEQAGGQGDQTGGEVPTPGPGGEGEGGEQAAGAVEQVADNATAMPDLDDIDLEQVIEDVLPALMALAVRAVGVLILLVIAYMVARWVGGIVKSSLNRARVEETVSRFLAQVTRWGILILAIVAALSVFGVNTTSFAAVLGALGLAIGLGFQGALANIAAGVLLLIFKPFRVGDLVEVHGELGIVEEIELYFTRINKFDNQHVIMPNDEVLGNKIENYSRNHTRRVEIPVGVSYSADPDRTREVLEGAIERIEGRDENTDSQVVFMGFGDSSVDWEVRVFCHWRDWLTTRQNALREVWYALEAAGITIPFPQRDVHLDEPVRIRVERDGGDGGSGDGGSGGG